MKIENNTTKNKKTKPDNKQINKYKRKNNHRIRDLEAKKK